MEEKKAYDPLTDMIDLQCDYEYVESNVPVATISLLGIIVSLIYSGICSQFYSDDLLYIFFMMTLSYMALFLGYKCQSYRLYYPIIVASIIAVLVTGYFIFLFLADPEMLYFAFTHRRYGYLTSQSDSMFKVAGYLLVAYDCAVALALYHIMFDFMLLKMKSEEMRPAYL
ncbi:unnamed protein product [Bursaphelenchus xylophilus]|uniref:(pine wood nematode) hypothetical protein n=1 Tax=Bursaphelenchus xylophilus TaxID=6326 RepID=A0A1I7RIZ6_BURXY|nr:unnamed protein product [Bursaphelenchus xylophilus]CAG9119194.1 unnamed protein product [Bursaphelenchus xylophilus]